MKGALTVGAPIAFVGLFALSIWYLGARLHEW